MNIAVHELKAGDVVEFDGQPKCVEHTCHSLERGLRTDEYMHVTFDDGTEPHRWHRDMQLPLLKPVQP